MTYKKYIKSIKKQNILVKLLQLSIFIITIILWEYLSQKNYISFIFSSPKKIVLTIINLYKQKILLNHILTTITEIIISFVVTNILALLISIFLYNNIMISKILEPYLVLLNSIPKVSLGPIIILLFGSNQKSIIIMSIMISIIVSILNIYNGFKQTDKTKLKLFKMLNASKLDTFIYLIIPHNKSIIYNTIKINISMCLIGVISGEFLTSKAGIGYLILYGMQIFNLDLVMSGLFILIVLSTIIYKIISCIIKE